MKNSFRIITLCLSLFLEFVAFPSCQKSPKKQTQTESAELASISTKDPVQMDAQTRAYLNKINTLRFIPIEKLPLSVLRTSPSPYGYESKALIKKTEQISIPGPSGEIPLRIYTPEGQGPFPVFVNFHGGGWTLGGLHNCDGFCAEICNRAQCIVVSVDYHLAPEYKFPKPLLDCYTATQWAAENISKYNGDPKKIAVGGDSAGGNLATAVALMARDKKSINLCCQVLMYPVTNYNFSTDSYQAFAEGYMLTTSTMKWMWENYLSADADGSNPYASPLQEASLRGLPQALVITAEFDPLRDDSLAYAKKLAQANVEVVQITYPTIHGFISFADRLDVGKAATMLIANYLHTTFAENR